MRASGCRIVHAERDFVVAYKAAGVLAQALAGQEHVASMQSLVARACSIPESVPRRGMVHRLDKNVKRRRSKLWRLWWHTLTLLFRFSFAD